MDEHEFAEELLAEVQALLAQGQKIEAVKRYRAATGASLADAKAAVELLIERQSPRVSQPPGGGLPQPIQDDLLGLLQQGRKIEAVRRYREATGTGLKEAKEAVEAFAAQAGLPVRSGCFAGVLALVVGLGAVVLSAVVWNAVL